ncbi:MAG: hypothetical protein ACD_20C00163G0002 [uncultured bacterium]|nr:MAG: hypothetical protein ACD_20C00163G0002 [uncultured bacterium]
MNSMFSSGKCPVCNMFLSTFIENCKRCGCDIPKLANIQCRAFCLRRKGQKKFKNLSRELYQFEDEEYLYLVNLFEKKDLTGS